MGDRGFYGEETARCGGIEIGKEQKIMANVLKIGEINLGEGKPKICVPLTGKNGAELREEAVIIRTSCCDIAEWRVDHFTAVDDAEQVKEMLSELKNLLGKIPILFTCRTKREGGEKDITSGEYVRLCKEVIRTGDTDLVDVEMTMGDGACRELIEYAHSHNTYVVVSSHDFEKTPDRETLTARFRKMQELGADVPKIAVMPRSAEDVVTLLGATSEFTEKYADRPVISMSMGWLGSISRVAGEFFGSALTFASAKHASAPGQLSVSDADEILQILHNTEND